MNSGCDKADTGRPGVGALLSSRISRLWRSDNERRVLCRHVFRNAMLLVVAGFPAALIGLLLKLISDLTYMMIDPRIDFATRRA